MCIDRQGILISLYTLPLQNHSGEWFFISTWFVKFLGFPCSCAMIFGSCVIRKLLFLVRSFSFSFSFHSFLIFDLQAIVSWVISIGFIFLLCRGTLLTSVVIIKVWMTTSSHTRTSWQHKLVMGAVCICRWKAVIFRFEFLNCVLTCSNVRFFVDIFTAASSDEMRFQT